MRCRTKTRTDQELDRLSDFESEGREFESLRARQTVLPGSRSISRLPLILTWYGRKQGNAGTRNAGAIHAATLSRPDHWTAFFVGPRFCEDAPADRLLTSKLAKSAHG